MAWKSGGYQSSYTGHPALVFWLMSIYYKVESWQGKLTVLEMWYSHLAAYLPEKFRTDTDTYERDLLPRLEDLADQIIRTRGSYRSSMEGMDSCDPDELKFMGMMFDLYYNLDQLTAVSRVVEGQKIGPTPVPGADE